MTDTLPTQTLPFAPAQDPTGAAPHDETPSGRKVEPRLLALGATLAVLAVGGGAFFLLRGGGGGTETTTVTVPVRHAASASASPTASAAGAAAPIAKYTGVPAGRDPFKPLVVAPAPRSTTAASSGVPSGPSSVPSTLPSGVPSSAPGTVPGVTSNTASAKPVTLVLRAIVSAGSTGAPWVEVVYDGQSKQLKVGGTLDDTVKLVSIGPDNGVATFQIGDGTYDLHVGQQFNG